MKLQNITFNIFRPKITYKNNNYFQKLSLKPDFDTFTFTGKGNHFTPDEVKEQKEKIKTVLQEAVDNNQTLSGSKLSQKTGIALHNINSRLYQDEELSALWQQVKLIENSRYSNEEKILFKKVLKDILESADKTNAKISMRELDKKLGVSKTTYLKIIAEDEYLKELYEKVRKGQAPKIRSNEEKSEEEKQIKILLLDAAENNIKRTDKEYGRLLGMSSVLFRNRVNNNPELKALYEQIKNPPRKTFDGGLEAKKEEIKLILKEYMLKNKKLKAKDLIKMADISYETLRRIVLSDDDIAQLWKQVQTETHTKYSKRDIETIDNYIHRFLTMKAEKQEKTTIEEIAKFYGLTRGFTYKRLRENPSLNYRWQKVKSLNQPYYDKFDKELQTEQIIDTLKEAVKNNENVTLNELSERTKLSKNIIRKRISDSPRATKWWKENKKQNF